MNSTRDLKNRVYLHLAAGILLSVVLCVLILASKYKDSLITATAEPDALRMNVLKMEHLTRVMQENQSYAVRLLPADYNSRSHQEILLLSLEGVRRYIKGADIIVGNFTEENDELTLPVTLEFSAGQYYEGLNTAGYLLGLRFPYFRIRNIAAKRNDAAHEISWRIEGSFRIPSGRITGIPDQGASH